MTKQREMEIETQRQLEDRIESLGAMSDEQKRHVVCALIGHSRYITAFFGYQYCGRCGDKIGDTLASVGRPGIVNAQHLAWGDCEECEQVRPSLNWKDTYLLTDEALDVPFPTRAAMQEHIERSRAALTNEANQ